MNRDELQELLRDLQKGFRTRDEICDMLEKQNPGLFRPSPVSGRGRRTGRLRHLVEDLRLSLARSTPGSAALIGICAVIIVVSLFSILRLKQAPARRPSFTRPAIMPGPSQRAAIRPSVPAASISQPPILPARENPFAPQPSPGPILPPAPIVLDDDEVPPFPETWEQMAEAAAARAVMDQPEPVDRPDIRLVAVLDSDAGTGAVIEDAGGTRVVRSGAALEDGWRITHIRSDRIVIARQNVKAEIRCGEGRSRSEPLIPAMPAGVPIRHLRPGPAPEGLPPGRPPQEPPRPQTPSPPSGRERPEAEEAPPPLPPAQDRPGEPRPIHFPPSGEQPKGGEPSAPSKERPSKEAPPPPPELPGRTEGSS